jgi:hypothetical protein
MKISYIIFFSYKVVFSVYFLANREIRYMLYMQIEVSVIDSVVIVCANVSSI